MIFTEKQELRIKALQVVGLPKKTIKNRFSCSFKDLRDIDLRMAMTIEQAMEVLLGVQDHQRPIS